MAQALHMGISDELAAGLDRVSAARPDRPHRYALVRELLGHALLEIEDRRLERTEREQRLALNALRAEKAARLDKRAKRHAARVAKPAPCAPPAQPSPDPAP